MLVGVVAESSSGRVRLGTCEQPDSDKIMCIYCTLQLCGFVPGH